jgi:hypothetical protein
MMRLQDASVSGACEVITAVQRSINKRIKAIRTSRWTLEIRRLKKKATRQGGRRVVSKTGNAYPHERGAESSLLTEGQIRPDRSSVVLVEDLLGDLPLAVRRCFRERSVSSAGAPAAAATGAAD